MRGDVRPERGETEAYEAGQNDKVGQGEIRQEPTTQVLLQSSLEQEVGLIVRCQHRPGEGEHGLGADLQDGEPEEAEDKCPQGRADRLVGPEMRTGLAAR
jgi:hypothetical protein